MHGCGAKLMAWVRKARGAGRTGVSAVTSLLVQGMGHPLGMPTPLHQSGMIAVMGAASSVQATKIQPTVELM